MQAVQIVNQAIWLDPERYGEQHAKQVEAASDREVHKDYLRLMRAHGRRERQSKFLGDQPHNKRMRLGALSR